MKVKQFFYIMLFGLCLILCFIVYEVYISYNHLKIQNYTISSKKIQNDVNIVLISDLHNHEFGKDNKKLVEKIRDQEPDLILLVGDILNDDEGNSQVATNLISKLQKISPVYYSLGNHEENYMKNKDSKLILKLKQAGAIILEREYKDIILRENKLRLGGMYQYAFALDGNNTTKKENMNPEIYSFLKKFENTKSFSLMMAHRPDSFIFGEAADTWNIDLVVSGHNHGGQVILPGIGGLYGGDQGWFPEYVDGIHHFKAVKNMIITRGLGTHKEKLPRFHNVPEIVHITLKAE